MSKGTGVLSRPAVTNSADNARDSLEITRRKEEQQIPNDPPPIIDIPAPKAWLSISYHKQISNRLSDEEKKEEYHAFYRETLEEFRKKNLRSFTYLIRVGNNKKRDGYVEALKKVIFRNRAEDPAILEGVYEPFENRNGNKLLWVFLSFIIGSVIWLMMLLLAPFKEGEPENFFQKRVP